MNSGSVGPAFEQFDFAPGDRLWERITDQSQRCEVHPKGDPSDRMELTVFSPIEGLGAAMWDQEARALVSMSGIGHPALPEILDGGIIPNHRIAFILTRLESDLLDQEAEIARLRSTDKPSALRQFDLVVDGLRRLHDNRLLHRNIGPSALRFVCQREAGDGSVEEEARIQLCRFEMATLISNFLRGASVDAEATTEQMRSLLRQEGDPSSTGRRRAYLAPERVDFVMGKTSNIPQEWDTTDTYGLGVLAFELFYGALEHLDGYAKLNDGSDPAAHVMVRRAMLAQIARHRDEQGQLLPVALSQLVRGLLETDPGSRWNAHRAATFLEEQWAAIDVTLRPDRDGPSLAVAFMPRQCGKTMYDQRGWLRIPPTDAAGRDELKQWFEQELRAAELVHVPGGATGFATHRDPEVLRQAEWALVGERAIWFCAYLRDPFIEDRVLVIKFLRERDRASGVLQLPRRRRLEPIDLIPWNVGQVIPGLDSRPSWHVVAESARQRTHRSEADREFLESLDFLLEYQSIALDARTYAVSVERDEGGRLATVRVDDEVERQRRHRWPLLGVFAANERRRPRLGHFLAEEAIGSDSLYDGMDDGPARLELAPSRRGRPDWRSSSTVHFEESTGDPNVVRLRSTPNDTLPESGSYFLRMADDRGSEIALQRQTAARPHIERRPALVSKLREPTAIDLRRPEPRRVDDALEGDAPDVVRDILARFPIYAVQGPPGTGKTTLAAEAIRLHLADDPTARILVSAQSNFALNNLGMRIIRRLANDGDDSLVLREVTGSYDLAQLPDELRSRTPNVLAEQMIAAVVASTHERLESRAGVLSSVEKAVLGQWCASLEENSVEMAQRIRRSAAVILATCSTAANTYLDSIDPAASFGWVLVEEAAKAWPTELMMALVLGNKWTLIGDQAQLGAHRGEDVEGFLDEIRDDPDPSIAAHFDKASSHLRVLDLFGSMFDQPQERQNSSVGRLTLQFRMDEDIAEVVSRSFYPVDPPEVDEMNLPVGFLRTAPRQDRAHPFHEPPMLRGATLLWLDTTHDDRCADEAFWLNRGEAALVAELVRRMRPLPVAGDGPGSLAVLTPYRKQVGLLRPAVDRVVPGVVHTVHSFQGQEADCTIVSLVRDQARDTSRASLGHVDKPELVNVLLSRAKRLSVVVGSIDHFHRYGSDHWRTVCNSVRTLAESRSTVRIIDSREVEVS